MHVGGYERLVVGNDADIALVHQLGMGALGEVDVVAVWPRRDIPVIDRGAIAARLLRRPAAARRIGPRTARGLMRPRHCRPEQVENRAEAKDEKPRKNSEDRHNDPTMRIFVGVQFA